MALATLHMAAIPVLAGLVAGTGAVTAYMASSEQPAAIASVATVTAPSPVAIASVPSKVERPCGMQTWPYIDQKCIAASATAQDKRTVRVVMAPRANEPESTAASGVIPAAAANAALAEPALGSGKFDLVSRSTALRQPDSIEPKQAPAAQAAKPRAKAANTRRDQRHRAERHWTAQSYAVPTDPAYRTGEAARPVIIIRPLPLSSYSSR